MSRQKGYKHTEETKRRMSLAKKGKKQKPQCGFQKGHFGYGKDVPRSQEVKDKISRANKGRVLPTRGKNHYNWKGRKALKNKILRHSSEYRLWRESVFERDNYTCMDCGGHGGYLHPHHILPLADYPELACEVKNGITLHKDCHMEFHGLKKGCG